MKSYASSVLLEEHKAAKYAAKQFSVGSVLYRQQLISRSGYFSIHFTIQSVGSPYVGELGEEDSYLSGGILSVLLLWRLCIFLSTCKSTRVCESWPRDTTFAKVTINKHPSYVTWLGLSDNFQTRLFIISAMQLEYPTGESCYPTSQGGPESHRWRWLYVKEENSSCDCG